MRLMFKEQFPREKLSDRTKRIVGMVTEEINALTKTDNAEALAISALKTAGLNIKSVDKGTDALFFMGVGQAKALARLAVDDPEIVKEKPSKAAKEKAASVLRSNPGIDIALFGRMVAEDPSLNTDACSQVAHSISTHKISNEYDYFSAVDDRSPVDNAGAAHIDTTEYNSSTLYRYATVAVHALARQLEDEAVTTVKEFVRAFVLSMPRGKQNAFANRTVPDAILVTVRTDQPINFAGAFEKPVPSSEEGYVSASSKQLVSHVKRLYRNFSGDPVLSLTSGELLEELGDSLSFGELLDVLEKDLQTRVGNGGKE